MSLARIRNIIISFALAFAFVGTANAQWELSNEDSTLSFVTTKADNVAEVHTFDVLQGSIAADGALTIDIELASVNTMIPIRNERMQNMLFETGMFPQAKVTGTVDMASLLALTPGSSTNMTVEFNLNLHAKSNILTADLTVTRLADGFLAATRKPLIVNAEAFGLTAGVEALREIAGLSRISNAVPVSFVVSFTQ